MTLRPRRHLALLTCVAVVGCASARFGSRARLEQGGAEPAPIHAQAELRWRLPLSTLTDLDARSRSRATPLYDAGQGVLYVGGLDRGVYAIRASDATVLWRFQTLGAVESTPVLDRGTLYVGSGDGALYALDAATGRMRWRFPTVAEIVHPAVVVDDSVYCVNADDTVFAVNRTNGEQRWRYRREPPGGITGGGHAGLLRVGRRLFTGFSDGRAVALDTNDGAPLWERDTSTDGEGADGANEAHRTIDVDTTPVMAEGNLFVASYTAGLYALDPEGGGVRWRIERLLNVSALETDGRNLYVVSANSGLVKVSAADGEVQWARDLGSRSLGRPVLRGPLAFVSSSEASVWVVRTEDGDPIEGLGREGVSGVPLVTRNDVFFETDRGVVYAWRYPNTQN